MKAGDRVLDIGMGTGQIAEALMRRTGRVVGTGYALGSYGVGKPWIARTGIAVVEAAADKLPFAAATFSVAVMSHILEHTHNVGLALAEVWRVLRPEGLLCVLVPPHEAAVSGGHVSIGWNIGQLMYVLALHGFDTRQGHYVHYGYNICAFVRKDMRPLPALRHDFGDLHTLMADGRFPAGIRNEDASVEAFDGELNALNWPWVDLLGQTKRGVVARRLRSLIPWRLRRRLARALLHLGHFLLSHSAAGKGAINPETLQL
jgi:SAM-dependent methyltransferase